MRTHAGWQVHGIGYPLVWWARKKPRSRIRQWLWNQYDHLQWRRAMRYHTKREKMTDEQLRDHINRKYGHRA